MVSNEVISYVHSLVVVCLWWASKVAMIYYTVVLYNRFVLERAQRIIYVYQFSSMFVIMLKCFERTQLYVVCVYISI